MTITKHNILKVFGSGMPFSMVLLMYYVLILTQPNGVIVTAGSEFLFEAVIFVPVVLILMSYSFCCDVHNLSKDGPR